MLVGLLDQIVSLSLIVVRGHDTDGDIVYLEDVDETTANPPQGEPEPNSDAIVDEEIAAY